MNAYAFFLVAIGGAFGAIARYGLCVALPKFDALQGGWPLATFLANAMGSLLIGVIGVCVLSAEKTNESLRLFLIVGMLGGFTTFSSFSLELLQFLHAGRIEDAGIYWLASSFVFPFLCAVGWWGGRYIA